MTEDKPSADIEQLVGRVVVEKRHDWIEAGLRDAVALEADLGALDLSDAQIATVLREREVAAEQLDILTHGTDGDGPAVEYQEPLRDWDLTDQRRKLIDRFYDRLAGRRFVFSEVAEHEVQVPLFVLAAPEPAGCRAAFSQDVMAGRALAWNVTLFGSGFGGSTSLRVTSTWRFEAAAGHSKQVFLPVTVKVATVRVMAGERVVTTTRQVVASKATPAKQPGLTLLPPDAQAPAGPVISEYPLAGDTSGSIANYGATYATTSSGRLEIGAEVFGAVAKLSADVSFDSEIALSLELRGGHDYSLRRLQAGQGMAWSVTSAR
ncbi:hypothetical protein ACWF0M_17690 [Kribbella sp. NPDC055110]